MKTPQLVPNWLKFKYPITRYVQDAYTGNWWNITASGLTTKERVIAVSLRWRWHALNHQSEDFAEMIPNEGIRIYTLNQIKRTKRKPNQNQTRPAYRK